jgi:hypothetical protein
MGITTGFSSRAEKEGGPDERPKKEGGINTTTALMHESNVNDPIEEDYPYHYESR